MSLTLFVNPNKTPTTYTSNVNAGITQLPYRFRRQDYGGNSNPQADGDYVDGATDGGNGNMEIQLSATQGDVLADWAVGESIFYLSGGGLYESVFNIIATSFTGGSTRLECDTPYIGDDLSGTQILNKISARPDYAVNIIFEDMDNTTVFTDQVFVYRPSQAGNLFIDFGGVVISYMENLRDADLNYRIRYRENYTGIDDAYTLDTTILCLLAERGIGQIGGSNLYNYLLRERVSFAYDASTTVGGLNTLLIPVIEGNVRTQFYIGMSIFTSTTKDGNSQFTTVAETAFGDVGNGNQTLISTPFPWIDVNSEYFAGTVTQQSTKVDAASGLFLTHFKQPNKWIGWHQTVEAVMDANYTARTGFNSALFRENTRDINGNASGDATKTTGFGSIVAALYPLTISDPEDFTGATVPVVFNDITVREADAGSVQICEVKRYRYQEECANPIMLTWLNSLGTREFYLFTVGQGVRLGADAGLTYEPAVQQDVETLIEPVRRINSDEILQITCTARDVPVEDIRALHELKTAEFVRVFNTKDGEKEINVIVVNTFETVYGTNDITADFSVTIEFPGDYDWFNIKEY